jgi:hypothetical protein
LPCGVAADNNDCKYFRCIRFGICQSTISLNHGCTAKNTLYESEIKTSNGGQASSPLYYLTHKDTSNGGQASSPLYYLTHKDTSNGGQASSPLYYLTRVHVRIELARGAVLVQPGDETNAVDRRGVFVRGKHRVFRSCAPSLTPRWPWSAVSKQIQVATRSINSSFTVYP